MPQLETPQISQHATRRDTKRNFSPFFCITADKEEEKIFLFFIFENENR